ncbi:MAG: haloacid dehalogenase [Firmicutes bacterium HGW-Firmicutes-4]|nr:MAG: haloacid dehalogenase [Firmicutes bacterium HGW-Firmicutes-4]
MQQTDYEALGIGLEKPIENLSVADVYIELKTSEQGLTSEEAAARLAHFGENSIQKKKGKPLIWKFLANFTHLMAILLWIGGVVALIAQLPQLAIAIWLVNVINGLFSFWQEFQAEKAIEALGQLLPTYARVIRDGAEVKILAEELVPGDLIILAEGDRISADSRLVEDNDFRADQSILTGESHPAHKTKDVGQRTDLSRSEQPNLIFAGTNAASGACKAVVFATGMNTEFGKIADLTQNMVEVPSPLQLEMGRITRLVSAMAISMGVLFFALAVLLAHVNITESFIFAMGMIVAFIPEGLLPTVTLSLAMGVKRMAKRNALIKRLSAVETLGCTTVICTDKTGTLTQNEMTVSDCWMVNQQIKVTGVGYAPEGELRSGETAISLTENRDMRTLLLAASLCNNSRLLPPSPEINHWNILGDPTEAALVVAARKGKIDLDEELSHSPRLRELPFESHRKRMSTIHQVSRDISDLEKLAYIKGAPKEVLDLCTHYLKDGEDVVMDEDTRKKVMAANDDYARKGLRVLAVAMRILTKEMGLPERLSDYTPDHIENNLTFLGLTVMADPPRVEVAAAVKKCHQAGIKIIMITGDYGLTAESIARRIGIIHSPQPRIVTGVELDEINDEDLKKALTGEIVFARVAPEQKLRVVTALQEMGNVVAVTGDGVNDSPALKKADIGIAMGISGTDVAKEAADMILTDDNFASIVNAVEEGRGVYNNIRKFATYILNSNVPEAVPFIVFLFAKGQIPLPLTVMQILAVDLGTDMIPAIALGVELPEVGVMQRSPRSQQEHLLNRPLLIRAFLFYGIMESAIAMSAFFFLYWQNGWPGIPMADSGEIYRMATTMTLGAIVVTQIGIVFNCRTERASVFKVGLFGNHMILIGIICELTVFSILIYTPFLHEIFNTAPIGLIEWAYLFMWVPVVILIDEMRKAFLRSWDKRRLDKKHNKTEIEKGDS